MREVNIPLLGLQVMQVLMDESGGSLPLVELCMRFESLFGCPCDVKKIREELQDFVQVLCSCFIPVEKYAFATEI